MDRGNDQSENVELPTEDGQEKKVISGDMNVEMNLDAIKEVIKTI